MNMSIFRPELTDFSLEQTSQAVTVTPFEDSVRWWLLFALRCAFYLFAYATAA